MCAELNCDKLGCTGRGTGTGWDGMDGGWGGGLAGAEVQLRVELSTYGSWELSVGLYS